MKNTIRLMIYFVAALLLLAKSESEEYWLHKVELPAQPSSGRLDPVLSNIAYIRLRPDITNYQNYFEGNPLFRDCRVIKQLLTPEQSISYNKNRAALLKKNINISELMIYEEPLLRTFIIEFPQNMSPEMFCTKAKSGCGEVEVAEPYYLDRLLGQFVPNDPLVPYQWMLPVIKAFEAWDINKGSSDVVIGISDSGVLQEHEDIFGSLWHNKGEFPQNGIDEDSNGYVDDYIGVNFAFEDDNTEPGNTYSTSSHGTCVAGIAGATVDNKLGLAGIAFNCKIFPMKTMINFKNYLVYGYQSLLYAAMMNFDIVNCSWGGYSYSCVNESIVRYVTAKGTAIVAGAGNHGTTSLFYPADFDGVLAVGVTNPRDTVDVSSAIGANVDLMTPGQETTTTYGTGEYGGFCCTSGASPIGAGAAALVRAKFPDLSSRQALEVTRLGSDNIEALNPEKKGLIPCRLNMYKAVSRDPFDYPSIRPIKVNYLLHDSLPKNRFFTGDTLRLNIICRNYLGKARNVGFKLSTVGDSTKSISIIADSVWLDSIDRESLFTLDKFIIAIKRPNYKNPFLRVDITADSAYKDFFLIEFIPTATYTDFSNDSISITLADNGRIGYADPLYNTKGIGFGLNSYCSLIAEGGLMVSEYGLKLVSNVRDTNSTTSNDFTNIKPFQPPDENIGIFSDEYSANRIGLEITEKINLVGKSSRFTRIEYDIKNVSNNALDQVSAGLFLDWEIGFEGDSNMIVEFPEGFPPDIAGLPHVSALISRQGNYPFAGAAVWTYENWSNPVLSGFPNKITYSDTGFTFSKKYKSLNSGVDINIEKPTDIASVIGMKFMGPMIIGDSRQMYVCLCAGYTPSEIWKSLWNCIDSTINSVSDNQLSTEAVTISPQPASDKLIINTEVSKINNIEIYNLTGILMKNIIFSDNFNEEVRDSGYRHILDIYDLPSGFYTMKISADEKFYFIKFIVIK